MFETILAPCSRLNCLVNKIVLPAGAPSEAIDIETYRRIIEVNLTSAVLCAHKVLAHFVSRGGGGSIVNCSSIHQIIPKPGLPANKGGMANLARTLALEFAGHGIRVNPLGPGAVDTPINAAWTGDEAKRTIVESHSRAAVSRRRRRSPASSRFSPRTRRATSPAIIHACGGLTLFGEFRESWAS
jgi:glucose 1-dehydrogenase